jgi:hypothetical protein
MNPLSNPILPFVDLAQETDLIEISRAWIQSAAHEMVHLFEWTTSMKGGRVVGINASGQVSVQDGHYVADVYRVWTKNLESLLRHPSLLAFCQKVTQDLNATGWDPSTMEDVLLAHWDTAAWGDLPPNEDTPCFPNLPLSSDSYITGHALSAAWWQRWVLGIDDMLHQWNQTGFTWDCQVILQQDDEKRAFGDGQFTLTTNGPDKEAMLAQLERACRSTETQWDDRLSGPQEVAIHGMNEEKWTRVSLRRAAKSRPMAQKFLDDTTWWDQVDRVRLKRALESVCASTATASAKPRI